MDKVLMAINQTATVFHYKLYEQDSSRRDATFIDAFSEYVPMPTASHDVGTNFRVPDRLEFRIVFGAPE